MKSSKEHRLLHLMDQDDQQSIQALCKSEPELERAYRDFLFLYQGFRMLKIERFANHLQLVAPDNSANETKILEGMKGLQVEQFRQKVQHWEDEIVAEHTPKIRRLQTWKIVTMAASVLILISAGLWLFQTSYSSGNLIEDFMQQGPTLSVRSGVSTIPDELWKNIEDGDWSAYRSNLAALPTQSHSIITSYYDAYALMKLEDFTSAEAKFAEIEAEAVPIWSEFAGFNQVLCLFQLQDPLYKIELKKILSDPSHELHKIAKGFAEKFVKDAD